MPVSSFALLTTQVETSGYGRIGHRVGTVLIHFSHKLYSCFHIGGKKDRINEIKKGRLWGSLAWSLCYGFFNSLAFCTVFLKTIPIHLAGAT